MVKRTLAAALFLAAGLAYAQPTPFRVPPRYTVATAPACVNAEPKLYAVTDGNSATDCATGGGSTDVICKCIDGVASAVTSGAGSGNSFETINAPAGTDPVAESATDTLNVTCAGGLTCTGTAASDTLDFTMGTASAATALAANGANCSANQYPLGVDASGAAESCTADDDLPDADEVTEAMLKAVNAATDEYLLTYESTTGDFEWAQHAPTASALAANGSNCSAGQYPLGVDASGASESCTADDDTPDSDSEVPDAITVTGAVSPSAFTFPASAAPAQTTDAEAAWDSDDNRLTVGDGVATAIIYPGAHAGAVTDGGAATTATALAANGANCSAGNYPLGVDASGAVESCTAVGGGIGGSTGATDDAILIADGVGGATLAASAATLTAAGSLTIPSAEQLKISTAVGLSMSAAGIFKVTNGSTGDGTIRVGNGSSTAPAYSFSGQTGSGLHYAANNDLCFGIGGNVYLCIDSDQTLGTIRIRGDTGQFSFDSGSNPNGLSDTGLARNAAGVVRVTNGSTGLGNLLSGVLVEANTAGVGTPNLLAATESGTVITNEGATAKAYQTLPSAVAGYKFTFIVMDTDGLRVTANTGDDLRIGATASTTAGYCESTTIGDSVTFLSVNAVTYVATALVGSGWTCG